jgi:hypothetical protein
MREFDSLGLLKLRTPTTIISPEILEFAPVRGARGRRFIAPLRGES